MISHYWAIDTTVTPPPSFLTVDEAEIEAHARADSLMTWGHAVAFGGSLAGIVGGFGLVAYGTLSSLIVALLFTAPVAGIVLSSLLYVAAWYVGSTADKHGAGIWDT
jgi:hypothetical protein